MSAATETIAILMRQLAEKDEWIAEQDARLEKAHRHIGALQWEVGDLKRQLGRANEAVTELQKMNERAQEDA